MAVATTYKDYGQHNPVRVFTVTDVDGAEVATATTDAQTVTVTGLLSTDILLNVSIGHHKDGLGIAGAYISDDDELTITYANPTAGALTPTADATYQVTVIRL